MLGSGQRGACNVGRFSSTARDLRNAVRHLHHRLTGLTNLARLFFRCGHQAFRRGLHRRRCLRHLLGRLLHPADQLAQFFHGVVHRVGDGAGNVFRHGGLLGQVTVCNVLQFVHQTQNCGLGGIVVALFHHPALFSFALARFCFHRTHARIAQVQGGQAGQADHGQDGRQHHRTERHGAAAHAAGIGRLQVRQLGTQLFVVVEDLLLGALGGDQARQVFQNDLRGLLHVVETGRQFLQVALRLGIGGGRQAQRFRAVEQSVQGFTEGVGVLTEQERRFRVHAFAGQELVHVLTQTLRQHHQLRRGGHFTGRRVGLQLHRRDLLGFFQQFGVRRVEHVQRLTHRHQRLFLRQNGLGALVAALPLFDRLVEQCFGLATRGAHTALRVAILQRIEVFLQTRAALLELGECVGVTQQRHRHRLGQSLRVHQRVTGNFNLHRTVVGLAVIQVHRDQQGQQADHQADREDTLLRGKRHALHPADHGVHGRAAQLRGRASGIIVIRMGRIVQLRQLHGSRRRALRCNLGRPSLTGTATCVEPLEPHRTLLLCRCCRLVLSRPAT